MIIELFKEEANNNWDILLKQLDHSNFYQSFANGQIEGYGKRKPRYLIYYEEGRILAMAMCLYNENIVTIPFGPILENSVNENKLYDILLAIENYLNTKTIFSIEESNFCKYRNILNNSLLYWDFTTVQLDIQNKSIEELKKNFNTNRRRILKRCLLDLKDSIIIDSKDNIDIFYDLYIKRLKETGGILEEDRDYFENLIKQNNTGVLLCKNHEHEILSGLIYYIFRDTLITRHNAFNSKYAKLNPGTFLDYYMINKVIQDVNLKYYDMSGLATGPNISNKEFNINRYKNSYGPTRKLHYKWLEFKR